MPRRMAAASSQDLLDAANTASGAWADTAYRSAANLAVLASRALVPHLQRPKPRGKPMPPHIRRGNATRGMVRSAVEHAFAAQKQRLRLVVRTVGLARVTTKIGLANLAYDLLRFTWLQSSSRVRIAPSAAATEPPRSREPPDKAKAAAAAGSAEAKAAIPFHRCSKTDLIIRDTQPASG